MKREWFVKIGDQQYGPYTIMELKSHHMITPDTLVRKDGHEEWVPIGDVKELAKVFHDDDKDESDDDKDKYDESCTSQGKDDAVLAVDFRHNMWIIWVVIALLVMYVIYRIV